MDIKSEIEIKIELFPDYDLSQDYQELCMSRRWPPPTYELAAEEGFPHKRTFSICCTIEITRKLSITCHETDVFACS
ncbi:UNVERIFIED_CONTAM: hypothetical protein RMT77_019982 [Armadillidium vulgare]